MKRLKNCLLLSLVCLHLSSMQAVTTFTVSKNSDPTSGPVTDTSTLRGAMLAAKDGDIINITTGSTILLTNPLPVITQSITIQGSGGIRTIDGATKYQVFSVAMGTLTLQNLTVNNGLSKGGNGGTGGGNGGGGGGGGAGGGGGLHIHSGAFVVIASNVSFGGNTAQGGTGGNVGAFNGGGGGGGYGSQSSSSGHTGNGGSGTGNSGGGGGGSHTAGGNGGTTKSSNPVSGGISGVTLGGGGGGGGGWQANQGTKPQDGASAFNPLTPPSGTPAYTGGIHYTQTGSGGGGAGTAENGEDANISSPGSGGDGIAAAAGIGTGFGGGGGGGAGQETGSGASIIIYGGSAFSAGGGGGSVTGFGGDGGILGGGGGGGGGYNAGVQTYGGNGGFGGGGGGGFTGGTSFFGGGVGGSSGTHGGSGGGGAGMGGAIFLQPLGSLTVQSGLGFLVGNTAVGGNAGTASGSNVPGTAGTGYGNDFFLASGSTLNYANASDETLSIQIVSDQGASGVGGGGLVMNGSATLTLSGNNSYTGSTQINSGILSISADNNLGTVSTPVQINNGATLLATSSFSMSSSRSLIISGSATIDVDDGFSPTLTLNRGITETASPKGFLTKTGFGTLIIAPTSPSFPNTYSAGTNIEQGTLQLNANGALVSGSSLSIATGGTFDMSNLGTSQTIGDLSGSGSIKLGSNQLIFGTATPSTTFSGPILGGGGGSLVKQGSGSVTLSGSNSYTGATTLAGGTLVITQIFSLGFSSTLSVTDNATLQIANPLTLSIPIAITAGKTFSLYDDVNATLSGNISETAASASMTKLGSGILTLTGVGSYKGGTTINAGTLSLQTSGQLASTGAVNVMTGATFDISLITPASQTIGALTGGGSVTLGAKTLVFGNGASGSFTFAGGISGTGSVQKTGSGTAIFSGTSINTYSGTTTISTGTLSLQGQNLTLPSSSIVSISGGAFLDISSSPTAMQTIGQLTGSGTVKLGTKQLIFGTNSVSPATFSGVIQDTGSILKQGTDQAIFTGSNTFSGSVTVQAGELSLGPGGSLLSTAAVIVGTGAATATFDISTGGNQIIGALSGASDGIVNLGGNQLTVGATTPASTTFAGQIQGAGGSIVKTGSNTLVLSGSSSYSGGTTLQAGTLTIQQAGSLGTGTVSVTGNSMLNINGSFTFADPIAISSGVTLSLYTDSTPTISSVISDFGGPGTLLKVGSGSLTLTNTETYTGGTSIQEGSLILGPTGALSPTSPVTVGTSSTVSSVTFDVSSAGATVTIGDLSGTSLGLVMLSNSTPQTFVFGDSSVSPVTFAGLIEGDQGSIEKAGSSVAIFTGNNIYGGSTTISAGTLSLEGSDPTLPNSTLVDVGSFATFDIGSSLTPTQTIGPLQGAANSLVMLGQNRLVFGGALPPSVTFSGVIQDTGGKGSILKVGSGTDIFDGPNTFGGGTTIQEGTLSLGPGGSLLATGSVKVGTTQTITSATFDISPGSSQTIGKLTGSSIGVVNLGAQTLNFGNGTTISDLFIFRGSILGLSGALIKSGFGTAVFTGTGSQVGSTTVSQGILVMNGAITSPVDVLSGAALIGNGTVNGTVTIENGGFLKPGDLIGTLTMSNLVLNPSSITVIALKGQTSSSPSSSSLVDVLGAAQLDGTLEIFAKNGYYPDHTAYTILEGTPVTGTFSSATYAPGSMNLGTINVLYNGGSPNTVVIQFGIIPRMTIDTNCLLNNPNGFNLANYLNGLSRDPVLGPIIFSLAQLSCPDVNDAMNSISPARNAIGAFVSENGMFLIASTVSCRMSQQRLSMRSLQMQKQTKSAPHILDYGPKDAYQLIASLEEVSSERASYWNALDRIEERLSSSQQLSSNEESIDTSPYGSSQILAHREDRTAFWVQGLAQRLSERAQDDIPGYHAWTGGALIGSDYYGEAGLLGAAVCYANSSVHQNQKAGKNSVDYYAATIYGTAYLGDGYLEFGLAGAVNRFQNQRAIFFPQFEEAPFSETAKSNYWGGQVLPHIAVGYDFNFSLVTLEPFVSVDCALLYQRSFSEHGASPLNMHQESSFSQLVRSEAGLHIYEVWSSSFGDFVIRESISYVNKAPFSVGSIQANLVGYPPGFSVDSFTKNETLISPALQIFYRNTSGAFGSLSYIGEFQLGSSWYVSNAVLAKLGCYF